MRLPFFTETVSRAALLGAQMETWTFPEAVLSKPGTDGTALAPKLAAALSRADMADPETLSKAVKSIAWLPWPYSWWAVCAVRFNKDSWPHFLKAVEHPEEARDQTERIAREIEFSRMEQISRARLAERVFAPARMAWLAHMLEDIGADAKRRKA